MQKLKHFLLLFFICSINLVAFGDNMVTDAAITTAVKAKLAAAKDVPSMDVTVTTNGGIVTLEGEVDTQLQLNRIVELASSLKSVNDVEVSKLTVKDHESFLLDSVITSKVIGRIKRLEEDKQILSNYLLQVETSNGNVHIWGEVARTSDISAITKEAKSMSVVKSVKTNIKVRKSS